MVNFVSVHLEYWQNNMSNKLYNLGYYEIMLRQNSGTAEKINKIRWDFVKEINPKVVLDFGCGVGWFRAWRPEGIEVDTHDIGPFPQTGIVHIEYDLITLWDVFEHLPNFDLIWRLLDKSKYCALSIPVLPKGKRLDTWKHFKPGEHLHYFTEEQLDMLFGRYGFEKIKRGMPECKPAGPREDIVSLLYKKSTLSYDKFQKELEKKFNKKSGVKTGAVSGRRANI